jgi:hypothetical protein
LNVQDVKSQSHETNNLLSLSLGGDFGGIDFSKLGGGAGGMPDMSAMGLEGMPDFSSSGNPDSDSDDEDEDIPDLEGEEKKEGEAAPKA